MKVTCRSFENDINCCVGLGGSPDRDGHVTLDTYIMNEQADCGLVAFLEWIKHPVSVARRVMERTPHVMLVGQGAQQFAVQQGFPLEPDEFSPTAEQAYQSGMCTTSGMGFKMRGRVGDSPIIGAGLFVDNEAGAAVATGQGEEVIRICGTHLVGELHARRPVAPAGL